MTTLLRSYKYYVAISSMCLGNFQQPSFFVFKIPNRIHRDPYVFFLTFVRANFPWNKLWDCSLGIKNEKRGRWTTITTPFLVFPTVMLTGVSKLLQRKENHNIGKYSFFLSLERKWQSYWPWLTCWHISDLLQDTDGVNIHKHSFSISLIEKKNTPIWEDEGRRVLWKQSTVCIIPQKAWICLRNKAAKVESLVP